jgi:hypothetical protein
MNSNQKIVFLSKATREKLAEEAKSTQKVKPEKPLFKPSAPPVQPSSTLKPNELEAIKHCYIGNENKPKRKRIKDKNFVFDWDASEDTLKDHFNDRIEPKPNWGGFEIKRKSKMDESNLILTRTLVREEIGRND